MSHNTIYNAYSNFEASNVQSKALTVRSIIHRFLVESWGGQAPKGSKATSGEVFSFRELLKTLPSTNLIGSMELLEQKFIEKGTNKDNSKSYRSAYKQFITWVEDNEYFEKQEEIEELKISEDSRKLFNKGLPGTGQKRKSSYHNRINKKPYALMAKRRTKKSEATLIYKEDYINDKLKTEIESFVNFRGNDNDCTKATIEGNIKRIYLILGWLHRYKNVPLEDLSLTSIIKFSQLTLPHTQFIDKKGNYNYHKHLLAEAIKKKEAISVANENKKLIEECAYFIGKSPKTKLGVVTTCIAIAKFVYKDEMGTDEYFEWGDLPIIKRLNRLATFFNDKAKTTPDTVAHKDKSVPWYEALNALDNLRARADCLYLTKVVRKTLKKGEIESISQMKRSENAIFHDVQTFLSLAFMLLIPTDRARTYYELEINRTFVYGLYEKGRFIPIDKLNDKNQGVWYIHLMPGDYKTGKIYKEYWGIMPNVEFGDGKKLYEYIDRWVSKGREYKENCNHNYFFRGPANCMPLNVIKWGDKIKNIFIHQTGVPVTPKEIRKMYVTHLYNIGANDAQLKGASYAQHHSPKMQGGTYNVQTAFERIAPIYELNEKIWKDATTAPSEKLSLV